MIENAQAALTYTAGMDFDAFRSDRKTYDAVERCLERIAEAAAKLGALAPQLMQDQPWDEIRGLGNRLRHEYDRISPARLWNVVQTGLPPLVAACEAALQRGSQSTDL
jgi:uncharacterized protein with HEPN domain